MADTSIEWTDKTWNPVRGCEIVSPGCKHCYAMKQAHRFSGAGKPYDGLTNLHRKLGPIWTGSARFVPEMLDLPLRWRESKRVFVNSMSDLFHDDVTFVEIDQVFAVMLLSPRHTFQVLTKRAERMAEYFRGEDLYARILRAADRIRDGRPELTQVGISNPVTLPAPWIWLGVSVEDQRRADQRIPELLRVPARVRFVSYEPALGPVWFRDVPGLNRVGQGPGIDWVIVGGESGPGARPFDVVWARSTIEQCKAAGVAVFVKQMGAKVLGRDCEHGRAGKPCRFVDAKGGDWNEWPEDLRVREWPDAR